MTRRATVVAKRTEVSGGLNNTPPSTTYYVTFETDEDGKQMAFYVTRGEFYQFKKGDRSILFTQGTFYKGFVREVHSPNE